MQHLSIFDFSDFPSYLAGYIKLRQKSEKSFSLKYLARHLGIRSPSLLVMVASGKRPPSESLLWKLRQHLNLTDREYLYAKALVMTTRARSIEEQIYYRSQLRSLNPRPANAPVSLDWIEYLTTWHHTAICEMSKLSDFKPDPKWIANRLGNEITQRDAEASLILLIKLGFLTKNVDGKIMRSAIPITPPSPIPAAATKIHQKSVLQRTQSSLEKTPPSERCFIGKTLTVKAGQLDVARKMLREFVERFSAEFQTECGDDIHLLTLQFVKVTHT
jgi:uncharacterized protein (TIGR02147 family)